MNLPRGVTYSFGYVLGQTPLIAIGGDALIRIESGLGYDRPRDRTFRRDVEPYLSQDYRALHQEHVLAPVDPVYSGAVHAGNPKLPNLTVVPNIATKHGLWVFGSTMGHYHEDDAGIPSRVQEVYEFQSYGAMVIDRDREQTVELCVAKPGDKVSVPNWCSMTLYNLDDQDHPLVTLDFASRRNSAHKRYVQKYGPVLLGYHTDQEAVFVINESYLNNPTDPIGIRLPFQPVRAEERTVRVPIDGRWRLGQQLYEAISQDHGIISRFAALGLVVRAASPEVAVYSNERPRPIWISRALVEACASGTSAYTLLMDEPPSNIPPAGSAKRMRRAVVGAEERFEPPNRVLQIVVEGCGDVISRFYHPVLKPHLGAGRATVWYADESRWWRQLPAENQKPYLDRIEMVKRDGASALGGLRRCRSYPMPSA